MRTNIKNLQKKIRFCLALSIIVHHSINLSFYYTHIGRDRLSNRPFSQLLDLHDLGLGHAAYRHVSIIDLYGTDR